MNAFVDGSTTPLRQKGKQTVKSKNLPVLVLSNLAMRQAYHKCDQSIFDTIARRFEEVCLEAPLEIEILTKERETASSDGPGAQGNSENK